MRAVSGGRGLLPSNDIYPCHGCPCHGARHAGLRCARRGTKSGAGTCSRRLTAPLQVLEEPDGRSDKFIVQQNGRCTVFGPDGRLMAEPFLDLRASCCRSAELRDRPAGLCPAPSVRPQRSRVCDLLHALAPDRARALEPFREISSSAPTPATWRKSTLPRSGFCWRSTGPAANAMAAPITSAPMGFSISALATAAYRMASARRFSGRPLEARASLDVDGLAQDTGRLFGKILRIDVDRGFPVTQFRATTHFASGPGKGNFGLGDFATRFGSPSIAMTAASL